ncbi:MAG: cation transporter, partial [Burkholderiaceae bacterium]
MNSKDIVSPASDEFNLRIEGMTCASCVTRLERVLHKVPGVVDASVNLATEKARIHATGVQPTTLIAAVQKAGFDAYVDSVTQAQDRDFSASTSHAETSLAESSLAVATPPTSSTGHVPGYLRSSSSWPVVLSAVLAIPLLIPMLAAPFGHDLMLPPWLQCLLATPIQFWLGARFYRAGWAALKAGSGNMDLLVAIGTSAAYGLSVYLMWLHGSHTHLYFESSAVVITLVLLGKWLESRAKQQTVAALHALAALR